MTWRERIAAARERGYFTSAEAEAEITRLRAQLEAQTKNALNHYELAIREMKLKEKAEQRVRELEAGLASKIGPDWREALPYETEIELADCIKKLKQQVWDITKGRDAGWAQVQKLEAERAVYAAWDTELAAYQINIKQLEHRLAEAIQPQRELLAMVLTRLGAIEGPNRDVIAWIVGVLAGALAPPPPSQR